MSIEELLRELKIDKEPIENENGSWTIELDNSNEYSRYYTKLDKSDIIEEDDEASQVSVETSSIQYVTNDDIDEESEEDDYTLTLLANFETEEYKLIIRKM